VFTIKLIAIIVVVVVKQFIVATFVTFLGPLWKLIFIAVPKVKCIAEPTSMHLVFTCQ